MYVREELLNIVGGGREGIYKDEYKYEKEDNKENGEG